MKKVSNDKSSTLIATLTKIIGIVFFIVSVCLVIFGQKDIGYFGLGMMLFGLAGILLLLYLYNKKFQ